MTRAGSKKASCASANATPCFRWFCASLAGSHSKLGFTAGSIAGVWGTASCHRRGGPAISAGPRRAQPPTHHGSLQQLLDNTFTTAASIVVVKKRFRSN